MSTHTPAPWVLTIKPAAHDADFTVAEIEQPRSVKYRGAVTRMQSAEHIYGIGREELIANARLISAAPDMLDALKQCEEYFSEKFAYVTWDMDGSYPFEQNQMLMLVSKAIAKAEGRT